MKFDKNLIEQRSQKLEEARAFLKTQFIGIDDCIDKFINSIKIWYILPELQTRPLIVCLWGITGVGKTDLVRKFVNFIDYTDKFCEIQMDSKEGTATVEDYLDNTLSHTDTGLLLLDEIQRFRSVNEKGEENNSTKYQDLWMLLSDGVLQSNSKIKQELLQLMIEEDYWDERYAQVEKKTSKKSKKNEETEDKEAERAERFKYKMYYYEASRLKKLLKLQESVDVIMTYPKEQKIELIKSKINSKEIYEGKKYNKLLIVISGNLDEAFGVADNVDDADLDADVYHEFSKGIDIIKIKKALKTRFKPEQIARFGNTHVIYPILNKDSNYKIIEQKIRLISENIESQHGMKIVFDKSVCEVVYKNGVFPVQGLRPLLSTISSIVENSIPIFLFECLQNDSTAPIVVSHENGKLVSTICGKKIGYDIPRVLDDIRKQQTKNFLSLVSVHEAGHAVAYAVLKKITPTQIVASTTDDDKGGFVGLHKTLNSKRDLLNNILIDFAGRAAEELVFGKELVTRGASSDFMSATNKISAMVRKNGMTDYVSVYVPPVMNTSDWHSCLASTKEMENQVEEIAKKMYNDCVLLLKNNYEFLIATADELFKHKKIEQADFKKLAAKYIGNIDVINSGDYVEVDYNVIFQEVVESSKTGKSKKGFKVTKTNASQLNKPSKG